MSDALCSAGVIFLCHMKDKKEPNHTHKAKILYSELEIGHRGDGERDINSYKNISSCFTVYIFRMSEIILD